jgi:CRP-like cAMP-binding protein
MFRFMVLEKCEVKSKAPGTMIARAGQPMDGMYILGGGSLEILNSDGFVSEELGMGDVVFPETVLSASPASASVRVGKDGALVLFANRMSAHELLATCPPFIELLAG